MLARREIRGLNAALDKLKEVDPKFEREAKKRMRVAAKPIIQDARSRIPDVPLSGWHSGRAKMQDIKGQKTLRTGTGFPVFEPAAARRRIALSIANKRVKGYSGRRRIVAIEEKDAAGMILDYAGRKDASNRFGRALNVRNSRASRFMWPAAEGKIDDVRAAMRAAIKDVEREMNRELRRSF